jgi:hypothetical protein
VYALGQALAQAYELSEAAPTDYQYLSVGQMNEAHCIRILHRPAEVDLDGLKNEGNAPRAQECIGLSLPAQLFANGRYPAYAAGLEETNCGRMKVSQDS